MLLFTLLFLVVISTDHVASDGYVNDWDQPFNFSCPDGQILSYISSVHSNKKEDRRWEFLCRTAGRTSSCTDSGYVNKFDEPVVFTCPGDRVMTGVHGYHSDRYEDAGSGSTAVTSPRDSNVFVVSVNVAAGSTVSFSLTYQELLQRKHGVYEQQIRVNHRQPIDDFLIEIFIQVKNDWISLSRPSPETAHVAYKPNQEQQAANGMSPKFVVQYDVEHSSNGDIVVVDGYFIHFFAADVPLIPKDIVFVLDVSGSMKDNKINQLKDAMKIILNDLQKEDRFNILFFSSEIRWWKDELVMVESETIQMALEFVESLNVAGGK
ncbi:Inter-alpha-trypsin inhibitor heavy chain H3 [Bulinus truncatus]|nr:Inter-alpha-trypsin inhibitor heavy chain H3 [Bulinus truncatus]